MARLLSEPEAAPGAVASVRVLSADAPAGGAYAGRRLAAVAGEAERSATLHWGLAHAPASSACSRRRLAALASAAVRPAAPDWHLPQPLVLSTHQGLELIHGRPEPCEAARPAPLLVPHRGLAAAGGVVTLTLAVLPAPGAAVGPISDALALAVQSSLLLSRLVGSGLALTDVELALGGGGAGPAPAGGSAGSALPLGAVVGIAIAVSAAMTLAAAAATVALVRRRRRSRAAAHGMGTGKPGQDGGDAGNGRLPQYASAANRGLRKSLDPDAALAECSGSGSGDAMDADDGFWVASAVGGDGRIIHAGPGPGLGLGVRGAVARRPASGPAGEAPAAGAAGARAPAKCSPVEGRELWADGGKGVRVPTHLLAEDSRLQDSDVVLEGSPGRRRPAPTSPNPNPGQDPAAGHLKGSKTGLEQGDGAAAGPEASMSHVSDSASWGSGASSSALPLPAVPGGCDWQIEVGQLQIDVRPDGSDWELGSGAYGKVYRGVWHEVQLVAIKTLLNQTATQQARFLREIALLRSCRSVHVVQFLGACIAPNGCTMLVTELLEGGALHDAIHCGVVTWHVSGQQARSAAANVRENLYRGRGAPRAQ